MTGAFNRQYELHTRGCQGTKGWIQTRLPLNRKVAPLAAILAAAIARMIGLPRNFDLAASMGAGVQGTGDHRHRCGWRRCRSWQSLFKGKALSTAPRDEVIQQKADRGQEAAP